MTSKPTVPVYPGTRVLCRASRGRILLVEAQAHNTGGAVCEACAVRGPCGRLQSELATKKTR